MEDLEADENDQGPDRISYINVKHGDEFGLSFKLGGICEDYGFYGILGLVTKNIEIGYGFDANHYNVDVSCGINPKKRVFSGVIGVGFCKHIYDNVYWSMEYKYKPYQPARKSRDLRDLTNTAFGVGATEQHDISDRSFKVRSNRHELSVRVIVSI